MRRNDIATVIEIEKLALDLPERDRAMLIANLLHSLPPILYDEDEGIAEALRRDAEMDADPSLAISFAELDSQVRSRRD
jgi:putative addiction module component (TIGR02574 family)